MKLSADSIFFNGTIYTMDETNSIIDAVAVKEGRLLFVGNNIDVMRFKGSNTRMVDLKGRTVIPGLIDTHVHILRAGLSELKARIFMPRSVEELLRGVRKRVGRLRPGEWLYLRNIYPTRLKECRYPTLSELDEAAPFNPVFVDGAFAGQANSCALEFLDLSDERVMRDPQGKPTGIIVQPSDIVRKFEPSGDFTFEDCCKALENIQACYNRFGITSVVDGSTSEMTVKAVNHLYYEGKLNIRLVYTGLVESEQEVARVKEKLAGIIGTPEQWGKLSFIKVMLDGGILTGTSFMRDPYEDRKGVFGINIPGYRGLINFDADRLIKIIAAADREKLQMTAHGIGDGAIDIMLEAYQSYNRINDIRGKRFSIIHCDFTDEETLKKIRNLDLQIFFQPAWHFKDAVVLEQVLNRRTISTFLPYRSYVEMGIKAAGGSDHMIMYDSMLSQNPYNPFMALYNMVTRKTVDGVAVLEEQKVSREQALRMYTCAGAYATFDEDKKGRLSEGMEADFAVLSKDYFNCPVEEIPFIESLLTVVGGRIVHGDAKAL